jgi:asparagine synthase (glutamine-hydrolysing)
MSRFLPEAIVRRSKRPYLAPEAKSFFGQGGAPDYVGEMLSDKMLRAYGYFNPSSVARLVNKCRSGRALGFKDNMALVGILSTQLLHRMFVEKFEFPADYKNIRFHDFKEAGQCASRSENSSRTTFYSAQTPA